MKGFLKGLATALITPFDGGGVNFKALGELIEKQIAGGSDALVVLGTTGEPATMTEEEKTAVMRFAVENVNGRVKVIFGTGSNCTAKAVKASALAEDLGADGVLAVTPYYNKCTQRGLAEYYKAICGAVHIPVIAYNVPSRTGVNITPATAAEISLIPNLAGIKEASGNMQQALDMLSAIGGRCDLFSGEDGLNVPIIAAGGTAAISVVSNLAPNLTKICIDYALKGELAKANLLQAKLMPLIKACFVEVNPIPVKYGCSLLGFDVGEPRAPLTPLEEEHRAVMKSALENLEII